MNAVENDHVHVNKDSILISVQNSLETHNETKMTHSPVRVSSLSADDPYPPFEAVPTEDVQRCACVLSQLSAVPIRASVGLAISTEAMYESFADMRF